MTELLHTTLLEGLGQAGDFADAACRGRWALFDPGGPQETGPSIRARHEAAMHVCATCPPPTFARCAAQIAATPAYARTGVWAGVDFDHQPTAPEDAE